MWRVFGGAALMVAGIAAFIVASRHAPGTALVPVPGGGEGFFRVSSGWSHTAYDLLHIGGWALVIVGALLIIVGLIALVRQPRNA